MGDEDRRDVAVRDESDPPGPIFWVGLIVGWAIIAYGLRGALGDSGSVRPFEWAVWIVGGNVIHDLIVVPAIAVIGVVIARFVHGPWRAPLQAGIIASAIVVAFAWIPIRGYGRRPDDPSALPLDYVTATLTVLAAIWVGIAVWLTASLLRDRAR